MPVRAKPLMVVSFGDDISIVQSYPPAGSVSAGIEAISVILGLRSARSNSVQVLCGMFRYHMTPLSVGVTATSPVCRSATSIGVDVNSVLLIILLP